VPRSQHLSRASIVEAAIELADREGAEAVTMRRLGASLGVAGMALYTYFRAKEELLGAVAARLLGELELGSPEAPWQERVRGVIDAWAGIRARHPGAFRLIYARRDWVREDFAPIEAILSALRDAGLPPACALLAYQTLVWLLDGILLGAFSDEAMHTAWRRGAALVDREQFPRYAEAAPHAEELSARGIFDLGAELLLRGLEDLVCEARGDGDGALA